MFIYYLYCIVYCIILFYQEPRSNSTIQMYIIYDDDNNHFPLYDKPVYDSGDGNNEFLLQGETIFCY